MNPFFGMIIAYLTGIVLCAICAFVHASDKSFADCVKESRCLRRRRRRLGHVDEGYEISFLVLGGNAADKCDDVKDIRVRFNRGVLYHGSATNRSGRHNAGLGSDQLL